MEKTTLAVLVTIAFSIVGVVGDYFLEAGQREPASFKSKWFYVGFAVYASTGLRLGVRHEAPQAGDDRRRLQRVDDLAANGDRRGGLSRVTQRL